MEIPVVINSRDFFTKLTPDSSVDRVFVDLDSVEVGKLYGKPIFLDQVVFTIEGQDCQLNFIFKNHIHYSTYFTDGTIHLDDVATLSGELNPTRTAEIARARDLRVMSSICTEA